MLMNESKLNLTHLRIRRPRSFVVLSPPLSAAAPRLLPTFLDRPLSPELALELLAAVDLVQDDRVEDDDGDVGDELDQDELGPEDVVGDVGGLPAERDHHDLLLIAVISEGDKDFFSVCVMELEFFVRFRNIFFFMAPAHMYSIQVQL